MREQAHQSRRRRGRGIERRCEKENGRNIIIINNNMFRNQNNSPVLAPQPHEEYPALEEWNRSLHRK